MKNIMTMSFRESEHVEVFIKDLCDAKELSDGGPIDVNHYESEDTLHYQITFQGIIVNKFD
tara:strand:+ start:451 stop:633 length:183 start_codon:yes stop_codon:yes gene_type:complete